MRRSFVALGLTLFSLAFPGLTVAAGSDAANRLWPKPKNNPVEVGHVHWGRDLESALKQSGKSGKPVFLLFQEVPGCDGCADFGQTVLTHPLMIEAIEDEFVPLLVYNNVPGKDEEIRKRFEEPAWNYQVVRFLDSSAKDIIPRKDKVWTIGALSRRMVDTLRAHKRQVPQYLSAVAAEYDDSHHGSSAFAQHCFWVGEAKLGGLEGVVKTEAGWLEGREVTHVVYDREKTNLATIAKAAQAFECADKVYAPKADLRVVSSYTNGELTSDYRCAKDSDQKRQVMTWTALHKIPGLTAMQKTKVNALAGDRAKALEWLSPRQRATILEGAKPKGM